MTPSRRPRPFALLHPSPPPPVASSLCQFALPSCPFAPPARQVAQPFLPLAPSAPQSRRCAVLTPSHPSHSCAVSRRPRVPSRPLVLSRNTIAPLCAALTPSHPSCSRTVSHCPRIISCCPRVVSRCPRVVLRRLARPSRPFRPPSPLSWLAHRRRLVALVRPPQPVPPQRVPPPSSRIHRHPLSPQHDPLPPSLAPAHPTVPRPCSPTATFDTPSGPSTPRPGLWQPVRALDAASSRPTRPPWAVRALPGPSATLRRPPPARLCPPRAECARCPPLCALHTPHVALLGPFLLSPPPPPPSLRPPHAIPALFATSRPTRPPRAVGAVPAPSAALSAASLRCPPPPRTLRCLHASSARFPPHPHAVRHLHALSVVRTLLRLVLSLLISEPRAHALAPHSRFPVSYCFYLNNYTLPCGGKIILL
ncbi:hypothetical protein DENSPDRAFT_886531 [Dentipellis sp. KUC8613]|nr:hypothetical protein DENSPDRAFT_886531 [Dentipellis sp. KUC8613]